MRRAGFTLIELLVVISIIAVLMGIVLPSLGKAREASRSLKCKANLRSIGQGLQMYMDAESNETLPSVRPLHGSDPGGGNDKSLLEVLGAYMDAAVPRRPEGEDLFIVDKDSPYRCPSDRAGTDPDTGFAPLWATAGVSYEYLAGGVMLFTTFSITPGEPWRAAQLTTAAYRLRSEHGNDFPILHDAAAKGDDSEPWHDGPVGQNALYYPDMRADDLRPIDEGEYIDLLGDITRMGAARG